MTLFFPHTTDPGSNTTEVDFWLILLWVFSILRYLVKSRYTIPYSIIITIIIIIIIIIINEVLRYAAC